MNTKVLISTLVGGIILFAWQSLSWTVLPIHKHSLKYTAGQETVLKALSENLEEGIYYVPYLDPDQASKEDWESLQKSSEGKPVAMINYMPSYHNNMGKAIGLGLVYSLLVALVISLVIDNSRAGGFGGRWLTAMGFAVVLILFDTMGDMNWWHHPGHWVNGELIDYLVSFSLAGLWFAWYWSRKAAGA